MTALALAAWVAVSASNGELEAAKAHFKSAEKLFREARYAEAIAEFEAAHRARPHGVLFFNIAKCYEHLGDLPRALRNYRRYLREVPKAKDRELISAAIANLETRLQQSGVQQLIVYAAPSGAQVSVDGKVLGVAPVAAELPPGAHRVVVEKQGFGRIERDVVMPADRSLELDVTLSARPMAEQEAEGGRAVKVLEAALVDGPRREQTAARESLAQAAPGSRRMWTHLASGVAGAGMALGVGLGAGANAAAHELRREMHSQADAQRLYDTAAGRARGANAAYGGAAVAALTAAILYFIEPGWAAGPAHSAAAQGSGGR